MSFQSLQMFLTIQVINDSISCQGLKTLDHSHVQ